MERSIHLFRKQKGQTLVLSVIFLGFLSSMLLGFFQVSLAVREKIRLQISADTALLSALNCEANALNSIALTNRAILANDALAAQLNAVVSESSFYRKLVERFSRILRLIPYAGPLSLFCAKGIKTIELIAVRTTSAILPLTDIFNESLSITQTGIHQIFSYHTIKAAIRILEMNMPGAVLTPLSHTALLRQIRSLQKNLGNLDKQNMKKMRLQTMDDHTRQRNWKVSVAGISPVKKSGGTSMVNKDLVARDRMRMKVPSGLRLRWKTVLSSKSRARSFNYHSPEKITTLLKREQGPLFSLAIAVQSDLSELSMGIPLSIQKISAVSAGSLVYKRPSRPDELPNTFNPFWSTTLIPVASESTTKKVIPSLILEEVRH